MDFLYPIANRENFGLRREIPVLSFFTGAGFLDIGFKRAGFKVVWKNEFDPTFIENHEFGIYQLTNSYEDAKINSNQSIEILTSHDILDNAFHNTGRPDIFGIIGGPPCPDFSTGGKNLGGNGDRGRLLLTYINKINEIQPTFFLVENVLGLVRTEKHRNFLKDVLEIVAPNYAISIDMLNSLEYGVAQDRYRIFIIGINREWLRKNSDCHLANNGIVWKEVIDNIKLKVRLDQGKEIPFSFPSSEHWFPWPNDSRYHNAKTRYKWPDIEVNNKEPIPNPITPKELMVGSLILDQNEINSLQNGTEGFMPRCNKFMTVNEGDVSGKSFKRLHRWRYSPTAAYGNNEVHLHPIENRRLTVREAFRIQSVPDEYSFPSNTSLTSKFKMIGNGVPVRLAEAVGFSIAEAIEGNFYSSLQLFQDESN